MKVLLIKTWKFNIGNEIIENGATALIKKVLPDAEIYGMSSYLYHVKYSKYFYCIKGRFFRNSCDVPPDWYRNLVHPLDFISGDDFDVAILPGCVLDDASLPRMAPILVKLKEKGIPLVLLGVGGYSYSSDVVNKVKKILLKVKPLAIITRDMEAYTHYANENFVKYGSNGIDCGFYISDWYMPPNADKDFIVLIFERSRDAVDLIRKFNARNQRDVKVLRLTHRPFNYIYQSIPADIFARGFIEMSRRVLSKRHLLLSDISFLDRELIFMSDDVKDYLFFFSNAREVHSDRVHAIVARVSYSEKNHKAINSWFYSKTPRALLFENVGIKIHENKVAVNSHIYRKRKKEMISVLRDILEDFE